MAVSGARRAARRRRTPARALGVLLLVVVVVALVAGAVLAVAHLTAGGDDAPVARRPAPSATQTALADLDTASLVVARTDFCARVAPAAAETALGSAPDATDTWHNGDRAAVAPGVRDVVHEFGCSWRVAGASATAWVFAPPVSGSEAARLARAAAGAKGCQPLPGAPAFGTHSVAVRCGGTSPTTTFHGLFGDAWLSCAVSGPTDPAVTERWCVTVAQAAAA